MFAQLSLTWSQPMYESHMKKRVSDWRPTALGATKSSFTLALRCAASERGEPRESVIQRWQQHGSS